MGTAYRNKGVQALLDAMVRYLPSPLDRKVSAKAYDKPDEKFPLEPDPAKPFVGMAFKIVEDPYGQLTFIRIYQGTINKGETNFNQRTGQKQRFSRILRMHADKREEIDSASAGDIVAIMGIDCASGDTYASQNKYCTLESMFVPEPVIKMAITPISREGADKLSKALQRFTKEDPTFRVTSDEETGETLIAGMGELHLEIYVERMRREYKRGRRSRRAEGQLPRSSDQGNRLRLQAQEANRRFGPVCPYQGGTLCRCPSDAPEAFEFEDDVIGGRIPSEYIPSGRKGLPRFVEERPAWPASRSWA